MLTNKIFKRFPGDYPVPDSKKSEYGTNPDWVDSTNDDKQ